MDDDGIKLLQKLVKKTEYTVKVLESELCYRLINNREPITEKDLAGIAEKSNQLKEAKTNLQRLKETLNDAYDPDSDEIKRETEDTLKAMELATKAIKKTHSEVNAMFGAKKKKR